MNFSTSTISVLSAATLLFSVVGISQDAKPAQGLNLDKFSELMSFQEPS